MQPCFPSTCLSVAPHLNVDDLVVPCDHRELHGARQGGGCAVERTNLALLLAWGPLVN